MAIPLALLRTVLKLHCDYGARVAALAGLPRSYKHPQKLIALSDIGR